MKKKPKQYSNPYQDEIWKANAVEQTQKERDEIDNIIAYCFIGALFVFMLLGYLLTEFLKLISK